MRNGSEAAGRARATAWQGRGEQAEPCLQELPGSLHLPLTSASTGRGHAAHSATMPRLIPHACPSCSSPIPAESMPRMTGTGLQPGTDVFHVIHPFSAQQPGLHIYKLTINFSITAHPHPTQPQDRKGLQQRAPCTNAPGLFFFKDVVYHTDKNVRDFQNCLMRSSFWVGMSWGGKSRR